MNQILFSLVVHVFDVLWDRWNGGGANILMLLLTKNEMRFKYDNL